MSTTTIRMAQKGTGVPTTTAPTTGTYYLRNTTASVVQMVVNDTTHRLEPGKSLGPFTVVPRTGGDVGTVSLEADESCGDARSGSFFRRGATTDIHIFDSETPCAATPGAVAPSFSYAMRLAVTG